MSYHPLYINPQTTYRRKVLFSYYCFFSVTVFIYLSVDKPILCTSEQFNMIKDVTRLPKVIKAELDLVDLSYISSIAFTI